MLNKSWTQEEEDKVAEMWNNGATYDDLAAYTRRSRGAISQKLRKLRKEGKAVKAAGRKKRKRNIVNGRDYLKNAAKYSRKDIIEMKLTPGKRYKIAYDRRTIAATCIKNYEKYILFKTDSGYMISFLKIELMTDRRICKKIA